MSAHTHSILSALRRLIGSHGLSQRTGLTLCAILHHLATSDIEDCLLSNIAALTGTTTAGALQYIDHLEAHGLLTRGTYQDDRRLKPLILTARGRAFLSRLDAIFQP